MFNNMLIVASLSFVLVGCDNDNPFINFKPYEEVPVLGKDNVTNEVVSSNDR